MRFIKGMAVLLASIALVACGGGKSGGSTGTSGGGGGGTAGTATLSVALSNTTVSAGAPVTVSATVRDGTGAGVAGQVVSFSTSGGLGAFSVNTALTDANGTATVSLTPATSASAGADQVIATTVYNTTTLTATAGFQLTASNVTITSFASDLGGSTLSAYGQTNLTVVASGGSPTAPVTINVSSACVAAGKATLTPTSATTSTGTATFTFRDQGCGATAATDSLQATIIGTSATSSLSIPLTSPTVQSIIFVSATPQTIYLKGSGLNETSTVVFRVVDTAGNGLPNQSVTLTPSTLAGGLTLDQGSGSIKLSDSSGNVIATVNSGTVPTPVRIKATLTNTTISTVSSSLAVAVGLPSELNFSLSQGTHNIEALNIDGTPNTYNIIASDRLGNPVPDGTAINFVAEGGQVEAVRFTALSNGLARATANFISSEPRPVDGRVTIVAYALGEESFLDQNGNNVYDSGEPFQDLGNLFLSRSFNKAGDYVQTDDQFIALSISASQNCAAVDPTKDPSNLLALNRSIPTITLDPATSPPKGTCDGIWGRAYVRRAAETVFSSSTARPVWAAGQTPGINFKPATAPAQISIAAEDKNKTPNTPATDGTPAGAVTLQSDYAADGATAEAARVAVYYRNPLYLPSAIREDYYVVHGSSLCNLNSQGVFSFLAADANGFRLNPLAAATTVSATATDGLTAAVQGGSPVPDSLEATSVTMSYKFSTATSGVITASFKSPGGLVTAVSFGVYSGACP